MNTLFNSVIVAIALGAAGLWLSVGPMQQPSQTTSESPRPHDAAKQEARQLVENWLDAQRRGRYTNGDVYWAAGAPETVRFFAVTDYEIVDDMLPELCTVRVHSSNRAGSPIVVFWEIMLRDGKLWRVTAQ